MRGTAIHAAAVILIFLLTPAGRVAASDTAYLTGGTVRGRALAMGGAYSSLEDDFSSGLYNPAAFRVNAARTERRYRLMFNPLGSAVAFREYSRYDREYSVDREMTDDEALRAAALLFKGAVFTAPAVDFGIVLHEPVVRDASGMMLRKRFLSAESLNHETFHTAFMAVKIAPSVALGLSGTLYRIRINGRDEYGSGHTFGVLLDPTPKMKVGVTYVQMPEEAEDFRAGIENIGTGSITGGVSYSPDDKTLLSVDVRNMNRDDRPASREIHTGVERVVGRRVALRAGYFRAKGTSNDTFSFGVGILPGWDRLSKFRYSTRNDLISYTFITEESTPDRRWHVLSLLLRF